MKDTRTSIFKKLVTHRKWDLNDITEDVVNEWKQICLLSFIEETKQNINMEDIIFDSGTYSDDFICNKITFVAYLYIDDYGNIKPKNK